MKISPGADQAFLVGERHPAPLRDGGQRRRRPAAPMMPAITQSAGCSAASASAAAPAPASMPVPASRYFNAA